MGNTRYDEVQADDQKPIFEDKIHMKKNHIAFLLFALLPLLCGAAHANVIINQVPGINATVFARYVTPDGNHMYLATSEGVKLGTRSLQKYWSWKTVAKDRGLPDNNVDSLAVATDKNGNVTALFVASANIKSGKGGISKVKLDGSGMYWTVNCPHKLGGITLSLTQNNTGLPVVLFVGTGAGLMKLSNLAQNHTPATIQWIDPELANYSVLVTYNHSTGVPVKLYALKVSDDLLLLYNINPVSPSVTKLITTMGAQDIGSGFGSFFHSIIAEMFKLNEVRQTQGYYMGEFEFKLLGIVYWIDHGQYIKAVTKLCQYYWQLKTTEGLIKVPPKFKNKQAKLDFYLSLQNPKTGAFMDDSYPFCEYAGPTANVLSFLDGLVATGQQLKLKYPLKFLDQINTPEKMKSYLDDISTIGQIELNFPQTTFVNARDILSLFYEDDIIDKYGLYKMPPETKRAILEWFYANQDPSTGLWGPKNKKGELVKKDTENSASIIKAFVDADGHNRFKDFPLKYREQLAGSFLSAIKSSLNNYPDLESQDLDQWHEWSLNVSKSMRTLTRYLWIGLSEESKQNTKAMIEQYIRFKFQDFYIKEEGAFSYYPEAKQASLDGCSFMQDLQDYGFCSAKNQAKLWNPSIEVPSTYNVSSFTATNFHMDLDGINSIRFYAVEPKTENCIDNVLGVFYPQKTNILDAMDLIPQVQKWLNNTQQEMGNWTSKKDIQTILTATGIKPTPVLQQNLPVEELNNVLQKNKKLILIGFDILQVPRVEAIYNDTTPKQQ